MYKEEKKSYKRINLQSQLFGTLKFVSVKLQYTLLKFNHFFLFTKRWFEIIRRDRGLSSHLCLTLSAKELLNVIKNSEWLWNNWPSLKTLKLSGKQFGPKADPSLKEINFKKVNDCKH